MAGTGQCDASCAFEACTVREPVAVRADTCALAADQPQSLSVIETLAREFLIAEYGVPEGAGLRFAGSHRMAGFGESWNCPAGGGRRVRGVGGARAARPGRAEMVAAGRAFSWPRACGC